MMRRPRDSNPQIRDNVDIIIAFGKAMVRINAQIHFVISIGDGESLRQFPWAGAKLVFIINAAAFRHQRDAIGWLDRADQDKAICVAFH
jgi:hypothetical protein